MAVTHLCVVVVIIYKSRIPTYRPLRLHKNIRHGCRYFLSQSPWGASRDIKRRVDIYNPISSSTVDLDEEELHHRVLQNG